MRTTGFIDVERVAKPFKRNMYRKERNRLSDENGRLLFHAMQNLCYLMKTKKALKGQVNDALATSFYTTFVDEVDMAEK